MDPQFEKRLQNVQSGLRSPPLSPILTGMGSDRYIPSRVLKNSWSLNSEIQMPGNPSVLNFENSIENSSNKSVIYSNLLKNELLNGSTEEISDYSSNTPVKTYTSTDSKNIFKYRVNYSSPRTNRTIDVSPYSLSPVSEKSQRLLQSPRRFIRKISRHPYKILDAPDLLDDFYLNLLDWSSQNIIGIGLAFKVYLWNAGTSEVIMCSDISSTHLDCVTSVSFNKIGNLLAIGTDLGNLHIWDIEMNKNVRSMSVHSDRIGATHWNYDMLALGSKDQTISIIDTKSMTIQEKLLGHKQEVCGLKWSMDYRNLASGSNDNKLMIWDYPKSVKPIQIHTAHKAAVKAIAWSPNQSELLASGGGTTDRNIRFWNTITGQQVKNIDAGSQVCALAWSKHTNELVSTHGYAMNEILLWRYPSLKQMARLTGHTYRVLYLALSPDGENIVTGAGDETLRFWNVFPVSNSNKVLKSPIHLSNQIR